MKINKKTSLILSAIFATILLNGGNNSLALYNTSVSKEENQLAKQIQEIILEEIPKPMSKKEMTIQKLKTTITTIEEQRKNLKDVRNNLDTNLAILMQNEEILTEKIKIENTWKNRRKKNAIMKKIKVLKKEIDKNENAIAKLEIKLINLKNDLRKFLN